jgi:hypothetical protein
MQHARSDVSKSVPLRHAGVMGAMLMQPSSGNAVRFFLCGIIVIFLTVIVND